MSPLLGLPVSSVFNICAPFASLLSAVILYCVGFSFYSRVWKMSSTDNLMSLLNQLQTMESTITDFLMETVLRFLRLTDAKVFLLVERGGLEPKRRYCGSPELLHFYENGGLCQQTDDYFTEIDSSVERLVHRKANKRRADGEFMNHLGLWSTSNGRPDVTSAKRSRAEKAGNGNQISTSPDGKSVGSLHESNGNPFYCGLKNEINDCVVIDDDDDDDDVDGGDESVTHDNSHPEEALQYTNTTPTTSVPNQVDSELTEQPILDNLKQETASYDPGSTFFNRLKSPELHEKKLAAILATDNPYAAYVKGTLEYKVWRSVLYQVGKNFALNCPLADKSLKNSAAQAYFTKQCKIFMRHCSSLVIDKRQRPEVENPENDCLSGANVAGFIRHSIRHGFLYIIRCASMWPQRL